MKLCVAFLCIMTKLAVADTVTRFSSGVLESYVGGGHSVREGTHSAIRSFIDEHFGNLRGFEWKETNIIEDKTHVHASYSLQYGGRRVVDRGLKVNASKEGGVESAQNNFAAAFVIYLPQVEKTEENIQKLKIKLWKEWQEKLGKMSGKIDMEPVVWIDPETNVGYPALDTKISFDHPWTLRHFILHEETGNVLEEKQTVRTASATVRVYKNSPYSSTTTDSVTLSDLTNTTSLRNSYLWVRRERINGASTDTLEVTPANYTDQGGGSCASFKASPTPSEYNYTCSGDASSCCNMAFDAVNVYYHLTQFRARIDNYLSQLSATVNWTYDAPVNDTTGATNTFSVLINPVSLDFGDSGYDDDANNAMYVGERCRSDGSMERCMVFLRPATLSAAASSAACSRSSATLFDLSREAIVVAHEYQHYVTDMITRIAFSSSGSPKVGDAIHEGYSDYMAASYVSDLVGSNATLVGQYALQQCTPLQRDISVLRPYDDNDAQNKTDVHLPGLSWASGFWKLRTEYGRDVADLLALKSLFYLSTTPGFIESIEAVVQADQALYQGAHVSRIREVFYKEVRFTGKNTISASGVTEIGFKGCAAVHGTPRSGGPTVLLSLFGLLGLLGFGRVYARKGGVQ